MVGMPLFTAAEQVTNVQQPKPVRQHWVPLRMRQNPAYAIPSSSCCMHKYPEFDFLICSTVNDMLHSWQQCWSVTQARAVCVIYEWLRRFVMMYWVSSLWFVTSVDRLTTDVLMTGCCWRCSWTLSHVAGIVSNRNFWRKLWCYHGNEC